MTDLPKISPYLEKMTVGFNFGEAGGQKLMDVLMQLCIKMGLPYYNATLWFEDIFLTYHNSARPYHNYGHIFNLLNLADVYEKYLLRGDLFRWAILYHDYIYDVRSKENEIKSAKKARAALEPYLKAFELHYIENLILATVAHHLPSRDSFPEDLTRAQQDIILNDLPFFLDFDMSILAAPEKIYFKYAQAVCDEYAVLYSTENYKRGRVKFLEDLLTRGNLFHSPLKYELQSSAWWNMKSELDMIILNVS